MKEVAPKLYALAFYRLLIRRQYYIFKQQSRNLGIQITSMIIRIT